MLLTHLVLFSFLAGASATSDAPVAAEASGGWWPHVPRRHWPRQESETDREARIKAERIRLGIIEPDPEPPTPAPSEPVGPALLGSPPTTAQADDARRLASLYAQAEALAEANATLELAGDLAALRMAEEIGLYFRIQEQQLKIEELRRDDDEAFLMILAVAIH